MNAAFVTNPQKLCIYYRILSLIYLFCDIFITLFA